MLQGWTLWFRHLPLLPLRLDSRGLHELLILLHITPGRTRVFAPSRQARRCPVYYKHTPRMEFRASHNIPLLPLGLRLHEKAGIVEGQDHVHEFLIRLGSVPHPHMGDGDVDIYTNTHRGWALQRGCAIFATPYGSDFMSRPASYRATTTSMNSSSSSNPGACPTLTYSG